MAEAHYALRDTAMWLITLGGLLALGPVLARFALQRAGEIEARQVQSRPDRGNLRSDARPLHL